MRSTSLLPWSLLCLTYTVLAHTRPAKRSYDTHNYYLLEHNPIVASLVDVALALEIEVVEQVGELKDHWLVRDIAPINDLSARGELQDRVADKFQTLSQLAARHSSPRSDVPFDARAVFASVKQISRQVPKQRIKRAPLPERSPSESESESSARSVAERLGIEDPLFPQQWHLVNDEKPEHMMNVIPVWDLGFTGKGVISSLVDDGLDYNSTDLKENFDAEDSYDFNDHVDLPTPLLSDDHHGTRCAGQIAAGKNTACGIGIAFNSKVAGVRILSGPITDVDEAAALNYGFQNVAIYSCSWGPPDNGQSMEGPSNLIQKAVLNGINNGRGGKGSIFVFASGNGAAHGDQCNFDGYTNSIYSVTVSAVDYKGLHPYYSEPCAANMIVAYSSGSGKHIVTTDKGEDACATTHGGTSAAAPNAVGVFALALEARPELTWRDIQYLCIKTARQINPDDSDWEMTAAGIPYSYKYGYGALDGFKYVQAALDWTLVKPQAWFKTHSVQLENGTMAEPEVYSGGQFIGDGGVLSTITVSEEMVKQNNFENLEHINVRVWIDHAMRGDVEVELVSPRGVKSVLGAKRTSDRATTGYPGWVFMTVKHWGEDPIGDWTLKVSDQGKEGVNGTLLGWTMLFWGSALDADAATLYELPEEDISFPPSSELAAPTETPTTTKQHSKPTAFLNTDHVEPTGVNAVPGSPVTTATLAGEIASQTSDPTGDEGWFPDLDKLTSNRFWFFGAIGIVALFGIGVGLFFWRRRVLRLRGSDYATLPQSGDAALMASVVGGPRVTSARPRTKELYDAFGEVSDDDDDANEETRLNPADRTSHRDSYDSQFLDEDGSAPHQTKYRDEPEQAGGSRA